MYSMDKTNRIENIITHMKVNFMTFRTLKILLERRGSSERINRSTAIAIAK